MVRVIDDIVKPVVGLGITASLYAAVQIGLYNISSSQLRKMENTQGISQTVQHARDRLTANISPLNYLFIPGYRISLVDYIDKNNGLTTNE